MAAKMELTGPEVVTQIGLHKKPTWKGFRGIPRSHEEALSMLLGEWDVDLAVLEAFGREATARDSVRHTTAQRLAASGFHVIHDQNPFPAHVSVGFEREWNEEVRRLLHQCFEDVGGQGG